MQAAAEMQNNAALTAYLRNHQVRLTSRKRLRGFSPELDALLHPYTFSDVQEEEIIRLLTRADACKVCAYRYRYGGAVACGLSLAACLYTVVHES